MAGAKIIYGDIELHGNLLDKNGNVLVGSDKGSIKNSNNITGVFSIHDWNTTVSLRNLTGMTSVSWGDGTEDTNISEDPFEGSYASHTYNEPGEYEFEIRGVNEIGDSAFYYCFPLQSIKIPKTVTYIGDNAFGGCSELTNVTFYNTVESIGHNAFSGTRVQDVYFYGSEEDLGNIEQIEDAFSGIPDDIEIELHFMQEEPEGGATGGGDDDILNEVLPLFMDIMSSTEDSDICGLYFPEEENETFTIRNLKSSSGVRIFWGDGTCDEYNFGFEEQSEGDDEEGNIINCYQHSYNELKPYFFRIQGVEEIGARAFANSNVAVLHIPTFIFTLGQYAFSESRLCHITLSPMTEIIPEGAFADCQNLMTIDIPDHVTEIEYGAFMRCTGLFNVNLGKSLDYIGPNAFWKCENLQVVEFPDLLSEIGTEAFDYCSQLQKIYLCDTTPLVIRENCFNHCDNIWQVVFKGSLEDVPYVIDREQGNSNIAPGYATWYTTLMTVSQE